MDKSWQEKAVDEYWDTVHKANAECERIKGEALIKYQNTQKEESHG